MNKLQKLMFTIGVLDKASAPIGKIQRRLDQMTKSAGKALKTMGAGTAGLAATAYTAAKSLQPARKVFQSIGEVASLDVPIAELQRLENAGLNAAAKYGIAADRFIGSSYDIQSSISGLQPGQLGVITDSMTALAIGTKADVGVMTSLMGGLYGIFEDDAKAMGVGAFSQQVAAYTAKSVQMFKTNGKAMEDAFRSVGALAKTHGIAMQEQFAVMGTLQATMPGAEAGTKYKAFLAGVGKAQKKLGLQFVDSQGKMLPMVQILEKIKGKYGELNTAEIDLLAKAFGSQEAVMVITGLIEKTEALKTGIDDIGNADFGLVLKMANAIADPWDKAGFGINAVTAKLGGVLLPIVNRFMDAVARVTLRVMAWMDSHPRLTKAIGYTIGILGAAIAAVSTLAIVLGVAKLASIAFGVALGAAFWPVTLVVAVVAGLTAGAYWLYKNWQWLKKAVADSRAWKLVYRLIEKTSWPLRTLWDLVQIGYGYWQQLTASMASESEWQTAIRLVTAVSNPIGLLVDLVGTAISAWQLLTNSLSDTSWADGLLDVLKKIGGVLGTTVDVFRTAQHAFSDQLHGLKVRMGIAEEPNKGGNRAVGGMVRAGTVYKVNERVPEILMQNGSTYLLNDQHSIVAPLSALGNQPAGNAIDEQRRQASALLGTLLQRPSAVPNGGIGNQIHRTQINKNRQQTGRTVQVRELHIHTEKEVDAERLLHELEMVR